MILGDKMSFPLISVVVPIYNVENYLERCIKSIVNQTYKNLEIILVDDGSPDRCPDICDEWGKQDSRIKVIHKKNGGLSDARNAGLKLAKGELISFIDSDDWINLRFFEVLYKVMIQENSDIVQCNYRALEKQIDEEGFDSDLLNISSFTNEEALSMLIDNDRLRQVVWNKLYKKEVIDLEFKKGYINEDEFWTYRIFSNASVISYVDVVLYYYFQRSGSIINENYSLKRLHGLEALIERSEFIEKEYPRLKEKAANSVYYSCVYACQMSMKYLPRDERRRAKDYIKPIAKKFKIKSNELKKLPFKQRIWISLSKLSFFGTCKIRSLLGVGF